MLGRRPSGGQAAVLGALALPALLLATLGVLEAGNAYQQSLAASRAAAVAVAAVTDLVGPGVEGDALPPFAVQVAENAARQAVGDTAEVVSVEARWGGPPGETTPYPGGPIRATVPLPRFDPGSTTLRWGEEHGFSYQFPSYSVPSETRAIQPQMGTYYDFWGSKQRVTVGGLPHEHDFSDLGLQLFTMTLWGEIRWAGVVCVPAVPSPVCWPVDGWGIGWSSSPVAYWMDQWVYRSRTFDGYSELNRDQYSYSARTDWVQAGASWRTDRWLEQVGWSMRRAVSDPNPQEGVVGEYAVYMGDRDEEWNAVRDPDRMVSRVVSVSVSVRLRALTPLAGWWVDRLVVRRAAAGEARL
jgi:hypothetical protein